MVYKNVRLCWWQTTLCKNKITSHKIALYKAMEQSVNMWNDLLKFIGCKLKWTRCVFYIIDWEFGTEKTPLTTHQSQQIKYYDALRITITLQQLKSHESMTYLTLISQINVSLQTQTSHLIKIAHSFSQILVSNHIQQYYAHTFQKWCINPKLTYSLAASSITNQQLDSIQKITVWSAIKHEIQPQLA